MLATAAMATVTVTAAPALASGTKAPTAAPKLTQLGHATFWECPAETTELLVAVNTLTLHPGATLTISYTVRNGAAKACNYSAPYADAVPGPTATTLQAGPRGSVGFEILGPHHANVWPGVQVVNCPALGFAQLPANGTCQARARGTRRSPTARPASQWGTTRSSSRTATSASRSTSWRTSSRWSGRRPP